MSEVRVNGLAELSKAMQQLAPKIEQNILRGALRAGGKSLSETVRAGISDDTGALKQSIRVSLRARKGIVTARVIAGNKDAFYGHMLEFGTVAHKINGPSLLGGRLVSGINHPGAAAKPFMRPALDNPLQAIIEVREYIRTRLRVKNGIDIPGPGNTEDE